MRKIILLVPVFSLSIVMVFGQGRQWDRPMQLKSCQIDIKADQFTATTFIEMEFFNPNNQEIEGLHRFQLKPGQVITAFQLELNGKYRDGSIEEKWKATNAYNTIVGKRIDPALLVMEYPEHYSVRIYPVPAKGSRKITITIQQLLTADKNNLYYDLPLNINDTVRNFKLNIVVQGSSESPFARPGLLANWVFVENDPFFNLDWTENDVLLKGSVSFGIPLSKKQVICTVQDDEKTHFALRYNPSITREYKIHPKQLTIFWDASGSLTKRNLNKEINFLNQFIANNNISQLTIIPFNYKLLDTAVFYTERSFDSRWQQYLRDINYDGSTMLRSIDLSRFSSDLFLLFTDGNNTYGKSKPKTGNSIVTCVHSSTTANLLALQQIAGSSGGKVIDLNKISMSDAVHTSSQAENWLLNITSASKTVIIEQLFPVKLGQSVLINGTMTAKIDTLYFHYGNNNKTSHIAKVVMGAGNDCAVSAIQRVTMLQKFDRIIRSYDWSSILDFGLQEKVVTPNSAYIVLERIEDYVKYNITPPAELEEECKKLNYTKKDTRSQRQQQKQVDEFGIISRVIAAYNGRLKKWDNKQQLIQLDRENFDKRLQQGDAIINRLATPESWGNATTVAGASSGQGFMDEVVVIGYGVQRRRDLAYSGTTIRSEELSNFGTIEQALQGRVAGLEIQGSNNGFLSSDLSSITIRDNRSINGSNELLFVLDGIPVSGNINNVISVTDIESVTVLKDAHASAIYGSRGANGVIVIQSKKGKISNGRNYHSKPYRLKDMEDVEYLREMKEVPIGEKIAYYKMLKEEFEVDPSFYIDIAQHFFECGLKAHAMDILMNAAEASNGSNQVLRAIGYVLENWKEFDEAARLYEQLLEESPGNIYLYRDLALAYFQAGKYQQAVDVLYGAIKKDFGNQETMNLSIKSMLLNELNAIIMIHKDQLDLSAIPAGLIRPMPVDLRIVLDCNNGSFSNVSVREPAGETNTFGKPTSRDGSQLNPISSNSYYGNPTEYLLIRAMPGKYRISVNYYEYSPGKIPSLIRVMVFRNFGKKDQSIHIENVIMNNQFGEIEIVEVKW